MIGAGLSMHRSLFVRFCVGLCFLLVPQFGFAQSDDEADEEDARAEAAQQLVLTARTMMRAKKYPQGIAAL